MGGSIPTTFILMNENLSGYPPHFYNVQQFPYIEYILFIKRRHGIVIVIVTDRSIFLRFNVCQLSHVILY